MPIPPPTPSLLPPHPSHPTPPSSYPSHARATVHGMPIPPPIPSLLPPHPRIPLLPRPPLPFPPLPPILSLPSPLSFPTPHHYKCTLTAVVADSFKAIGCDCHHHFLFGEALVFLFVRSRGLGASVSHPRKGLLCASVCFAVLPAMQSLEMQLDQVEETTAHARSTLDGSRRRHGDRCTRT